jgi:phosphatidylglycerol lysyltransferase
MTILRRAPATLAFICLLWTIGLATGSLLSGPDGVVLDRVALSPGSAWWTPLSSALWCGNLAGYLVSTGLLLVLVAPAEHLLGFWRTLGFLVVGQEIGGLVGAELVRFGSDAGLWWFTGIDTEYSLGPSIGAVAVGLALSFRLSTLWLRRLRLLVLGTLIMLTLYVGSLEDILRMSGAVTGLVAGLVVLGRSRRWPTLASSPAETRTLTALVLAASAVGPLLALFTRDAFGPLAELRYLFSSPAVDPATVGEICADAPATPDCHTLQAMVRAGGLGPAITSVVPVLITLAVAEGLRRGRRFAWWAGMLLSVAFAALIGLDLLDALSTPDSEFADLSDYGGKAGYLMFVAPLILQPVSIAVMLGCLRRHFDVSAPRPTYLRFWQLVGVTLLVTALTDVLLGYLARGEYSPAPSFGALLADLPARYVPVGYLFLDTASFLPVGPVASALYDYTGAVFWTVVLVAVLLTFWRPRLGADREHAERARELLVRHGGSSLSYMTMWPGNHYWFSEDGRCAVAYRVAATVALTTGDPLGPASAHAEAFRGFAEFCSRNGWTPCFYSATGRLKDIAVAAGWKAVQVAEDTVLPLAGLTFTGRKWQDVRTALNKAAKSGIVAEWCHFPEAPPAITDQVRTISEDWIARKGLPEMGFTLGGMSELADGEVRCLIAVDADRTVHGIVSWLPVYRDGRVVGWTLDFMRRRPGFPGAMEFLIASSAQYFRDQGAEFVSLSGAPLARLDRDEQTSVLQRILDLAGRLLEPVYGFGSLLAFKAKFQPVYRPLYLVYRDPAALLTIAGALGRAYLPHLTARQTLRLVGRLALH